MRDKLRTLPWLTICTVLLALWIAIPRLACAEAHHTVRQARETVLTALEEQETDSTAGAIRQLRPRMRGSVASILAGWIDQAAEETRLDPRLIVAIAYRESSFRREVAIGLRRGRLGETGLMQCHGYSLRFAPRDAQGIRCSQADPQCSIRTGARFLAHIRDRVCPGNPWIWISGYGRRSCPTETIARNDIPVRRARRLYCAIRSDCSRHWPE